jgi:hypothetical protein
MAFFSLLAGVLTLFMSKRIGFATSILSLVAALVQATTGMTLFWMCRRSLAASPDAQVWPTSPDTSVKTQLLTMFG